MYLLRFLLMRLMRCKQFNGAKASIGRDILGERYIADYMGLSDLVTVIGLC